MFGECHMHIFMDGKNYKKAVAVHKNGVQDEDIRAKFEEYKEKGITFIRDGGDALGVSARASEIAGEYGITYRTPRFAIHRNGHYGGIVGHGYNDMKEYHALVLRARKEGSDFIKLMFSGIMDFEHGGQVNEEPLPPEEIRELIHVAHEEGFSVMAHVNGARAVEAAVEGGVDSVEHGNFMDEECLQALAESNTVWVPTYVTITNLMGSGRFDDGVIQSLKERQGDLIRRGFELGATIALGSDAGAYCVPHGQGVIDEYHEFRRVLGIGKPNALMTEEELDHRLRDAEEEIRKRF